MSEYERLLDEELGCYAQAIALLQDLRLTKRRVAKLDTGARRRLHDAVAQIGSGLHSIAAEVRP